MTDYSDVMATLSLDGGVVGLVIPSSEDYGIIQTADPKRVIVTVPFDAVEEVRRGISPEDRQKLLAAMIDRINEIA